LPFVALPQPALNDVVGTLFRSAEIGAAEQALPDQDQRGSP